MYWKAYQSPSETRNRVAGGLFASLMFQITKDLAKQLHFYFSSISLKLFGMNDIYLKVLLEIGA